MRKGRRIALDVGRVRIGVAICDPEAIVSTPLNPILRGSDLKNAIAEVFSIAEEFGSLELYVGEPLSLDGSITASTIDAREFAIELSGVVSSPVRMIDERLTTVSAAAKLRSSGQNARTSKGLIDSASAVEILDIALNQERLSGQAPGILVADRIGA